MASKDFTLTQERLKELLHYNPETGLFIWRVSVGGVLAGTIAGWSDSNGYSLIKIDRKSHLTHRLAFLYMEGELPPDQVDHINRIRNDNRWRNLQHSTQLENHKNRKDNVDFIGVVRLRGRWQARASRNKEGQKYLGCFKTHIAACYCKWAWEQNQ